MFVFLLLFFACGSCFDPKEDTGETVKDTSS